MRAGGISHVVGSVRALKRPSTSGPPGSSELDVAVLKASGRWLRCSFTCFFRSFPACSPTHGRRIAQTIVSLGKKMTKVSRRI